MATKDAVRAVVVTTAKRGVFFGYTPDNGDEIVARGRCTLAKARMCTLSKDVPESFRHWLGGLLISGSGYGSGYGDGSGDGYGDGDGDWS